MRAAAPTSGSPRGARFANVSRPPPQHRDLKLENFIFETRDADSNLKLIDFVRRPGFCRRRGPAPFTPAVSSPRTAPQGLSAKYGSSIRRMQTMVGTAYYIAPEVLNQADGGSTGYTNACDCWSIGVIAYMLVRGEALACTRARACSSSRTLWLGRHDALAVVRSCRARRHSRGGAIARCCRR